MPAFTPLSIAVASDLHIGPSAKGSDLRPGGSLDDPSGYLAEFAHFARTSRLSADWLVISGDITDGAAPDQVRHASQVIERLAGTLKVPADRTLAIPGNHDLNWPVCKLDGDTEGFWSDYRFLPFQAADATFSRLFTSADKQVSLFSDPYYLIECRDNVLFCRINSAAHDLPHKKYHYGSMNSNSLLLLEDSLKKHKIYQDQLRVAIIHHHPFQHKIVNSIWPDFSIMANGGNILDIVTKNNFDILIHGHKHFPFFEIYTNVSGNPLLLLGAGSFSVQIKDESLQGRVSNQFHMIYVDGRDEQSSRINGRIQSWAHATGTGWIPSRERYHGIPHLEPFGKYETAESVVTEIEADVRSIIESGKHVKFAKLRERLTQLQYVPRSVQLRAVVLLAEKIGCEVAGMDGESEAADGAVFFPRADP